MIRFTEEPLMRSLSPHSVILHQVSCVGIVTTPISAKLTRAYPDWYQSYSGYCKWFEKDPKSILGTFHRFQPDQNTIVCSAFAQIRPAKEMVSTDYDAWKTICKKVESQTRQVYARTKVRWTIHVPFEIGCRHGSANWDQMMEIFEKYFENSEVEFIIHQRI